MAKQNEEKYRIRTAQNLDEIWKKIWKNKTDADTFRITWCVNIGGKCLTEINSLYATISDLTSKQIRMLISNEYLYTNI